MVTTQSWKETWKEKSMDKLVWEEHPCKVAGCHFIFHSKSFLLNHLKTDHTLEELALALIEEKQC